MQYKIAETAEDWGDVYTMMRANGVHDTKVVFPTVMAYDDEGLVGFVGTMDRQDMILAGPILMRKDQSRPFTFMQLIGMYENALRNMGITSFVFGLDNSKTAFGRGIKKYVPELVPYATDGDTEYYVRRLDGNESQRPEGDGGGETPSEEPSRTARAAT